jgi:tellurite resistance protein TerC
MDMITNEMFFFGGFLTFVLLMLVIDLGVFSKKSHTVSFKEAGIWSGVWVTCALIFYAIIYQYGDLIHGIDSYEALKAVVAKYDPDHLSLLKPDNFEQSLQAYKKNMALEFITGYLLEYSLSVDNIFVIILIFSSFKVEEQYYKKILFWGILGAIVMRFIFIFLGATLIQNFSSVLYLFGAFLLYTGVKMFLSRNDEEESIDPNNHPVVKFAAKYFSVYPQNVGDKFFHKENGITFVTPLFIVVLIIEFTDLIFAVDSVPAVFAVTEDQYIVFFSNIFAILGLRSMFFFLANIMHIFHYLKVGLSFLLIFIGAKMLAHDYLKAIGFATEYSLIIIISILAISVGASLLFPKKQVVKEIE